VLRDEILEHRDGLIGGDAAIDVHRQEVSREVRLKRLDRLFIDTCGSPVGPNPFPGLPDNLLGNRKRPCRLPWLAHRLLPPLGG